MKKCAALEGVTSRAETLNSLNRQVFLYWKERKGRREKRKKNNLLSCAWFWNSGIYGESISMVIIYTILSIMFVTLISGTWYYKFHDSDRAKGNSTYATVGLALLSASILCGLFIFLSLNFSVISMGVPVVVATLPAQGNTAYASNSVGNATCSFHGSMQRAVTLSSSPLSSGSSAILSQITAHSIQAAGQFSFSSSQYLDSVNLAQITKAQIIELMANVTSQATGSTIPITGTPPPFLFSLFPVPISSLQKNQDFNTQIRFFFLNHFF